MRQRSVKRTPQVVYLTGAPATGKSTLAKALQEKLRDVKVFEYGAELTKFLVAKHGTTLSQTELRERSSLVATVSDIAAVDRLLLAFVKRWRRMHDVIVDSHAVTKERYGFRITPYSLKDIARLNPTMICMLYLEPTLTSQRIIAAPAGRPRVSHWESDFHTFTQAAVAISYATHLGAPAYLLDGARPLVDLVDDVALMLSRAGRSRPTVKKRHD